MKKKPPTIIRDTFKRLNKVGIIKVDPSAQPDVAENWMAEYDERDRIIAIALDDHIGLYQAI